MIRDAIRQLRSNLGAFVLALLLAFVIWIAASLQTDPFEDRRFPSISLVVTGQPDNTVLLDPIVEQVVVTARARASVLARLRTSNFQAVLDLSGAEPGVLASIPISVTCTSNQVRVQAVEPSAQRVNLARVGVLTLPVTVDLRGDVATGYEAASPVPSPPAATVSGPEPILQRVVTLRGEVGITGARGDVTEMISLQPLDADGVLVAGLEVEPSVVQVVVPVRSLAQYKPDVQVVPDLRGEVAGGFRRGDVLVEPPAVTLEGPAEVLDRLPGFVETMPITLTGATETLSRRSLLTVPAEVSVVEVSYVTVTVEVLPILSTRSMTATVETLRVPAGMRATLRPSVVVVTLEGPGTRLAVLGAEDLLVVLDLRRYPRGVHRIVPDVLAPAGIKVLNVDPATVEVTIEPIPTPTPTPTASPTPVPTRRP